MFRPRSSKSETPEAARLARLHEISKALNSELDLTKLLKLIMDSVIDLTSAERGFIILNQDGKDRVVVARNMDREEVQRPTFKISHSIVEQVRRDGKAVLTSDAQSEKDLSAFRSVSDLQLRSILCAPFRLKEEVIGVVYLDHRFQKDNFTEEDLHLLDQFGDQAAIAIENARLYEENQRANQELERLNEELQEKVETQEREIVEIREQLRTRDPDADTAYKYDYGTIIGQSPAIRRIFGMLERVIDSTLPVVLLGESGTGKELFARVVHANGPRKDQPFVTENCGAIPESLMESEIFGSVKGAFTGADRDRTGVLERADGGTLFLDEIGEMDLSLQKKLLRALQEGEFRKVGGAETLRVDVRILSATNRDLTQMVEEGEFREDLYYRLKGVVLDLPPLRARKEDIPLLVEHFLAEIARKAGEEPVRLEAGVIEALCQYPWPGNVRELENEVRCLATLAGDGTIDLDLVHSQLGRGRATKEPSGSLAGKTLAEIEKQAILDALEACDGKKTKAAERLGIPRRTFYYKQKKLEESDGN